jgi:hypothetical protein
MKVDDILSDFVNRKGERKYSRQVGRYWASDVGSIKGGYLTPENFFKSAPIDMRGCKMILTGVAFEDCLTKIFKARDIDCETQVKEVLKINDEIDLVVKPDYVFPNMLIETKFLFSSMRPGEIPQRYNYQLECEYRAFQPRNVYLGVFSIPFNVTLIEYTPSKRRWTNIQKTLIKFHEELKNQMAANGQT